MRYLLSVCIFGCWLFLAPSLNAQNDDRADSTYDEDYRLYDRNEHGLDWNRYNYPDARKHKGYGY